MRTIAAGRLSDRQLATIARAALTDEAGGLFELPEVVYQRLGMSVTPEDLDRAIDLAVKIRDRADRQIGRMTFFEICAKCWREGDRTDNPQAFWDEWMRSSFDFSIGRDGSAPYRHPYVEAASSHIWRRGC